MPSVTSDFNRGSLSRCFVRCSNILPPLRNDFFTSSETEISALEKGISCAFSKPATALKNRKQEIIIFFFMVNRFVLLFSGRVLNRCRDDHFLDLARLAN